MPASITLSAIHWSTPDGRTVLSDLNLRLTRERVGIVGRNGVGKTTLLRLLCGDMRPTSGTVTTDGTIAVLRQMVQAGPDETIADLFGVTEGLALLRRAEAGNADLDALAEADWTLETRMLAALAKVGLDAGPDAPLATLSGGQRTRAALAGALFARPDFLLLDEPTNNLDAEGRAAVLDILGEWRGGAIVVSHDRALLETMDAIVELTGLGATRYGGDWSAYRARKALELDAAHHDLAVAERQIRETERRAQQAVERKQRRDSRGAAKGARGDMPRILIGARKERAQNSGGEAARLADRQQSEAVASAQIARARIEILEKMAVSLPPTGLHAGRMVLHLDEVTGGHDPAHPAIEKLSLTISGPERVALIGRNGSGKTTLLRLITGAIMPVSGAVRCAVSFAMLDQTAALLDRALSVAENFRAFHPGLTENDCRAALARFQFRADAALQAVEDLSGGQVLRAALATVLGGPVPPAFLILDEPTNHLDLDSIAAVEAGLRAYDGALLVASHDAAFLDAIGVERCVRLG